MREVRRALSTQRTDRDRAPAGDGAGSRTTLPVALTLLRDVTRDGGRLRQRHHHALDEFRRAVWREAPSVERSLEE